MNAADPDNYADDELIKLDAACRIFFRGQLTKSSLRTEARKGNLDIIRIAGKDFVTKQGIKEMIEKCRENKNLHGSGSGQTPAPGSSRTGDKGSAQTALRQKLNALKKSSPNTSPQNTGQPAAVVRLR